MPVDGAPLVKQQGRLPRGEAVEEMRLESLPSLGGGAGELAIAPLGFAIGRNDDPAIVDLNRLLQEQCVAGFEQGVPQLVQRDGRKTLGEAAGRDSTTVAATAEAQRLIGDNKNARDPNLPNLPLAKGL